MSREHEYFQIEDEDSRSEDKLLEKDTDYNAPPKWHQRGIRLPVFLLVCFVQLALYLTTVLYFIYSNDGSKKLDVHLKKLEGYYPALEAVEIVERKFGEDRMYWSMEGLPSQEVDDAWKKLLGSREGLIQAVPSEGFDYDRLPISLYAESFPDTHVYGVEMHHQLHCLDRIRMSFYPDHYFPNETKHEVARHREHCLDHIRQSIMCHGDFALDYWRYETTDNRAHLKTDVVHVCRDTSKLNDWVEKYRWASGWLRDPDYPDRDLRGTTP